MKQHLEAFTVCEGKARTYWTRIGVAFPNKNPGKRGIDTMTVILDAMPAALDGRYNIILLPPLTKSDAPRRS